MNILITGGTGFIGQQLISKLIKNQHCITLISRDTNKAKALFSQYTETQLSINTFESITELNDYETIINLAGEPIVGKRWNSKQKAQICNSRWNITAKLTALIAQSQTPPKVFISASAIGFYGAQHDQLLDEHAKANPDFGHQICQKWEQLALNAKTKKTRVSIVRIGIVLGQNGGALAKMLLPFKLGLGGPIANGKQGMSWIHIDDLINMFEFILNNDKCHGIYNGTAPNPVSNRNFAKTLAKSVHRPCLLSTPACLLTLAMGESANLLINGQFVIPKHALGDGFNFNYPQLAAALNEIINQK